MSLSARLVHAALANRAIVVACAVLVLLLGIDSARRLPIDVVPDVTNVQVQIITSAPALSPIEIEQYVSIPVERAMSGLPKTSEIRSLSKYGISLVTLVFDEGTEIYRARQLVSERLGEARDAVPDELGRPEMGPISSALGEVFQFVLRGDSHSLMKLEETLDWYIGPQLRTVPGVVETLNFGGLDRQYQVVVDPLRLQAAGLSVGEVAQALQASNANAGGGYIERDREQIVIGTDGIIRDLEDLKTVVVGATPAGVPITLENVAEARFGPKLRRGAASMDGQGEVVVGTVLMLMGENARTVTENVKNKLEALAPTLPEGMRIEPFYDRSELVSRTISTVARNLAEGALLVIVVLFILLGDFRAGLIVALTIPLAMCVAVIGLRFLGVSGNLMSLGAIDFGLIVDGTVIIVEHSLRRLRERPQDENVIETATLEVRTASLYGEAIIAVVYLPILTLRGTEGKLFAPMATTVLLALAGAMICSLTLVPVLCTRWLKPHARESTKIFARIERLYAPLLDVALKRRGVTFASGGATLALGAICFFSLGAEFIPQLDEGDVLVEARRLTGVALGESIATDARIQEALGQIPEVAHVVCKTGAPELAFDPMGIEQTDVYLRLRPRAEWRPGLEKIDLAKEISERLEAAVPDVAFALSQPIQMRTNELMAGIRSDVAAKIYGPDLDVLRALSGQVARVLRPIPGAVSVRPEQTSGLRYLRVVPDRRKLARYGLRVADVNQLVETIAVGHRVGAVLERDRRFDLVIRSRVGSEIEDLRSLVLKSPSGPSVPLGDVAELLSFEGPALVNRDALSRRTFVELNVQGRDIVSLVEEAKTKVAGEVKLPAGYRIEWGGQFQHYEEARARLLIVVPISLALIGLILWLAFSDLRAAALIFLNVPFAATGGAIALFLRGIPFSISAGVGFIALSGVAVLNGLVLVSFMRDLEASGIPPLEAVRRAARERLRPVLMTAAVAALGFVPMALSHAPGSEVQRPLATVVIGGLVTASLLTLLLFPTAYRTFARHR
jgi:heavy metal efflux system protein